VGGRSSLGGGGGRGGSSLGGGRNGSLSSDTRTLGVNLEARRVVGGSVGDDLNGVVLASLKASRRSPGVFTVVGGLGNDGEDVVEVQGVGTAAEVEGNLLSEVVGPVALRSAIVFDATQGVEM
jgi:hypothetical protein